MRITSYALAVPSLAVPPLAVPSLAVPSLAVPSLAVPAGIEPDNEPPTPLARAGQGSTRVCLALPLRTSSRQRSNGQCGSHVQGEPSARQRGTPAGQGVRLSSCTHEPAQKASSGTASPLLRLPKAAPDWFLERPRNCSECSLCAIAAPQKCPSLLLLPRLGGICHSARSSSRVWAMRVRLTLIKTPLPGAR